MDNSAQKFTFRRYFPRRFRPTFPTLRCVKIFASSVQAFINAIIHAYTRYRIPRTYTGTYTVYARWCTRMLQQLMLIKGRQRAMEMLVKLSLSRGRLFDVLRAHPRKGDTLFFSLCVTSFPLALSLGLCRRGIAGWCNERAFRKSISHSKPLFAKRVSTRVPRPIVVCLRVGAFHGYLSGRKENARLRIACKRRRPIVYLPNVKRVVAVLHLATSPRYVTSSSPSSRRPLRGHESCTRSFEHFWTEANDARNIPFVSLSA